MVGVRRSRLASSVIGRDRSSSRVVATNLPGCRVTSLLSPKLAASNPAIPVAGDTVVATAASGTVGAVVATSARAARAGRGLTVPSSAWYGSSEQGPSGTPPPFDGMPFPYNLRNSNELAGRDRYLRRSLRGPLSGGAASRPIRRRPVTSPGGNSRQRAAGPAVHPPAPQALLVTEGAALAVRSLRIAGIPRESGAGRH